MNNSKARALETTITTRYGVNALDCDALTVEWAAEHLARVSGDVSGVAKAWRRLNARRHKAGRHTTIPAWGTALFAAF